MNMLSSTPTRMADEKKESEVQSVTKEPFMQNSVISPLRIIAIGEII